MCGVVGLINLSNQKISNSTIKKMTDSIYHRGPDGEGQWTEDNVGIGHRRLSIIDLSSAGNQPMMSEDKRYIFSYNGEVYNFLELKKELVQLGYKFFSNTDTEVVMKSLICWGEKALLKFNGMFAFAFWDRLSKTLILARDRYGIKPMYYAKQGNNFFFSSEQKAILTNNEFKRKLNKAGLLEYLTFQNFINSQTLLEDINLLEAGSYIKLHLEKKNSYKFSIVKYWDYIFQNNKIVKNKSEYTEELERLMKQSVQRQLVSDVEVGSYLSGGIDSSSIVAFASKENQDLKTFTCGFDLTSASGIELNYDERKDAEFLSSNFGTEHYEVFLKSGDMEKCLNDVVYHIEEPRIGQSYPNYYVSKLASKFVKVVLSGSGGDELFAGYPWRYYRNLQTNNFEDYLSNYYKFWQRLIPNKEIIKVLSPIYKEIKDIRTEDIFKDKIRDHSNNSRSNSDFLNHSLYFECKTFLSSLFVIEDKLSMSHSLETRVPFMDNDVVDFAMKCPSNLKFNFFKNIKRINENQFGNKKKAFLDTNKAKNANAYLGKKILRDAMKKHVPQRIISAKKQGFSSPDSSWFRGKSINFVKNLLFNDNARIYEYLDRSSTHSLIKQHLSGKINRRLMIWSLLYLEIYLQKNL